MRLCLRLDWAPLHEVSLPNARRADILALTAAGNFVCIEINSGPRAFHTDDKWPQYRYLADALCFAVAEDFPQSLLPDDAGLIVSVGLEADLIRPPPLHRLAPARRTALLRQFARLAAARLAMAEDPAGVAATRAALRAE